jgi:hypothetical protein
MMEEAKANFLSSYESNNYPEPLIPNSLYISFIGLYNIHKKKRRLGILQSLLEQLPKRNSIVLNRLLTFLHIQAEVLASVDLGSQLSAIKFDNSHSIPEADAKATLRRMKMAEKRFSEIFGKHVIVPSEPVLQNIVFEQKAVSSMIRFLIQKVESLGLISVEEQGEEESADVYTNVNINSAEEERKISSQLQPLIERKISGQSKIAGSSISANSVSTVNSNGRKIGTQITPKKTLLSLASNETVILPRAETNEQLIYTEEGELTVISLMDSHKNLDSKITRKQKNSSNTQNTAHASKYNEESWNESLIISSTEIIPLDCLQDRPENPRLTMASRPVWTDHRRPTPQPLHERKIPKIYWDGQQGSESEEEDEENAEVIIDTADVEDKAEEEADKVSYDPPLVSNKSWHVLPDAVVADLVQRIAANKRATTM